MWIKHFLVSLFMLLLSCLAFQVLAEQTDIDQQLESQLDQYLELLATDREASIVMLNKLAETNSDIPALQSRARLLSYLTTNTYFSDNTEQSAELLQQLLDIAKRTENPNALTEIYATELEMLLYQGKLDDAIIKSDLVKTELEQATDVRIKFYAHNVLGRIYKEDGQYSEALDHFIQALDAIDKTDNTLKLRRRFFLNFNIAHLHLELKSWPQARQITEQLISDAKKYQFSNTLPELYLLLGYIAAEEKKMDEAITLYRLGLDEAIKVDWEQLALTFENNIGAIYIELEQYPAAEKVLLAALKRAEAISDTYSVHLLRLNLGYIRVMDGEQQAGIEQMLASLDYFENNTNKSDYAPRLEWLAKAYAAAGLYKDQAETLLKQMALQEKIRSADREARLTELQNRYDNKAKAQKIILLEQENSLKAQLLKNQELQQRLTFMFVLLMLFAAVGMYLLYRKVRQSNKKLYETNKQLAIQSLRDPLTGLYNRRALVEHMQGRKEKRRQTDVSSKLTGLLMLDIDFFKRINDTYGHSAGDAVLIEMAKRLQASCRDNDLVVRWGGEEILLLLDNISLQQVSGFIERILKTIAQTPVQFEQHSIDVTASGGFIHLPFAGVNEEKLDWEKVLQIVDMALYLSKANGRNQVCIVNNLHVSFEQAEALLYTDLSTAIKDGVVEVETVTGLSGSVN
ncbi:tetratricopeptide repeat-containing diguanylate cyclase [Pseudoalteromonas prydzensis]|uniref:tetratricopeptide repeat-containing diguanylate cyclase n=1 Tax=Pseudoalteromonas prydzensis TaxID=182141 RepID=UPI0024BC04AA|nr:GGDEF domain-containing protein [Pseudoalteromonas prydzensis]